MIRCPHHQVEPTRKLNAILVVFADTPLAQPNPATEPRRGATMAEMERRGDLLATLRDVLKLVVLAYSDLS